MPTRGPSSMPRRFTHPRPTIAGLITLALAASACATDAGTRHDPNGEPVTAELELAPPARGFQVQTIATLLEPGEDVRLCEVVQLPGAPGAEYFVARIEAAMTAHGQDLIVSAAPIASDTAEIMDVGARVPCTRAGEAFGEELTEVVSTQQVYLDQRYPEGVGKRLHGGQKIAVDYHFWNDGQTPIPALVKLNFHTADKAAVQHIAHTASFHNLTIYTPPRGTSSHLAECMLHQPVLVGELVRRTQRHGTDFRVWLSGGERDGELLWHSSDPRDSQLELQEPLQLATGEGFRFECAYQNDSDLELRFGVNAADEMCTLNAILWGADDTQEPTSEGCLLLEVESDGVAR